jgi:hypothetical protein
VAARDADAAGGAARELRSGLPGARTLLALRSPSDLALAAGFDGVIASWMTPTMLETSKFELTLLGNANPNFEPRVLAVVHAAVGADAETRLGREEGFARSLPAYRERFSQLTNPGRTGVMCDTAAEMPAALEPYERVCDELVIRGLAARKLWNLERIAAAAAPQSGGPATSAAVRPTSSSVSRETTAPNAK